MSDQHDNRHIPYWMVFGFLCVFTGISWIVDEMKDGSFLHNKYLLLVVIVMAVASAKALFVMLYFMHLKFEGKWKFVLLAPTVILAIGLPLALLPDIGVHYYLSDVPQNNVTLHETSHETTPDPDVEAPAEPGH